MITTKPISNGAAVGARLLAAPAADLDSHLSTFGPVPGLAPDQLVDQVRQARLTGRGGAAFPTAIKLEAVVRAGRGNRDRRDSRGIRTVVVANGAEGEPASFKDRHLLQRAPHLVLDGLQLVAAATGADTAYAYIRADAVAGVRQALAERARFGGVRVTVIEAEDSFVSGQETAVVSRLDNGPARPRFTRSRVTERGVHGRPTLVQNVETLAHLALIARFGGAWFAERGTVDSVGTFLATVHSGGVTGRQPPRVWEVPYGLSMRQLLASAQVRVDDLQAVLVGGYHGAWLAMPQALDAPLSADGLKPFGSALGAGVILPLTGSSCGLEATAGIVRYLAGQSARQCGPCQFGLPNLADLMTALGRPSSPGSSADALVAIHQAVGLVEGRGACHHPDGTVRLVRSALRTFEKDVVLHGHGRCLATVGHPYGGRS